MTAKCPVCHYDLPSKPIAVKVGQQVVKVCCEECAETGEQAQGFYPWARIVKCISPREGTP